MSPRSAAACVVVFLMLLGGDAASAQTVIDQDQPLRILSWNVYGLPRIAQISGQTPPPKKVRKKERAHRIADLVNASDYHILVLQETFHGGMRRVLRRRLTHSFPYQYGPANPSGASLKTNSGLSVYSRIPLRHLDEIRFDACTGVDCWAKKGAVLLQGDWLGVPFQVMNTHLNAGGPQSIRDDQYRQIREELLDRFTLEGVPQILCGDFNTQRDDPDEYPVMLDVLDARDAPTDSEYECTSDHARKDLNSDSDRSKCSIIDYVLHRANGGRIRILEKHVRILEHPWGRFGQSSLSDHFAVEVSVELLPDTVVVPN